MSEGTIGLPIFLQENCRTIAEADGIQSRSGAPERRKEWHVAMSDTAARSVSVGRDKRLMQMMVKEPLTRPRGAWCTVKSQVALLLQKMTQMMRGTHRVIRQRPHGRYLP